ncbi:MAG: YbaB/EbfC family nucleoid-associated protein [Myxococcota bacterium]|nr:YbaB/EbfC family nucleoid-associated protein [Myxococcota bacterium]
MNIQEMMRQAQRMKGKIEKIQEEVGNKTVEGTAGGGMVVVVANGKNEIKSVRIEKEVVDPDDIEMLQDLIVAATNQAISRAGEMMQNEVGKVTGGMGIPGMF